MCPDELSPGTSPPSLRDFVGDLVRALDPDARLVDLALVDHKCTLHIDLPGEVGKSFTVPSRVLEKALMDERVLTVLRNALRAALLTIGTQRTLQESAAALSRKSALCPSCSQRIRRSDPLVFEHGEMFHMRCRR